MKALPLLAAALLALAATPAAASSPTPSGGGLTGVSITPAHSDPANPATLSYFVPTVAPGGTFSDAILVHNGGGRSLQLQNYPVDAVTSPQSGAAYGNAGQPLERWGAWVSTAAPLISVGPQATVSAAFTVRVPAGATPGDHLAGIAFQDAAPPAPATGGGTSVNVVLRLVMAVLIHVPGPAAFHVSIESGQIGPLPGTGQASVGVGLRIDGQLLGHPTLDVTLDGPAGYHRELSRTLDTVLPGDAITYPDAWPETLAGGDYAITIVATAPGMAPVTWSGHQHLGQTLVGTAAAAAPVVTVPASSGPVGILAAGVGALLAVVICLLLWFGVILPRRRARPALSSEEREEVQKRLRSL